MEKHSMVKKHSMEEANFMAIKILELKKIPFIDIKSTQGI